MRNIGLILKICYQMLICSLYTVHIHQKPFIYYQKKTQIIKKNCILINTSRGEIIDEESLADLLLKKIGGAGLDVFEHEPQITQKLFESDNVVLLPHISSATKQSRVAMGERVLKTFYVM